MTTTADSQAQPAKTGSDLAIACPYCTASMPAESFVPWPPTEPRLITAECTGCARKVTLPSQWLTRRNIPAQPDR